MATSSKSFIHGGTEMMNWSSKFLKLIFAIFGLVGFGPPGVDASTTLHGKIPPISYVVVLQAHGQTGATDTLKFKFYTPMVPGAVLHSVVFCVGPAPGPSSDPCSQGVLSIEVPNGETRLAVIPASALSTNVLAVRNYIGVTVPFTVTME
jgi:hypothetical protein